MRLFKRVAPSVSSKSCFLGGWLRVKPSTREAPQKKYGWCTPTYSSSICPISSKARLHFFFKHTLRCKLRCK